MKEKIKQQKLRAEPPEEFTGIKVKPSKKTAGGIPAILSTVKHAYNEMGAIRGVKTLLKVNQKEGFDCQSCAWPDPDDERKVVEFCENGA